MVDFRKEEEIILPRGCGDGQLALALAQRGASVSAVDADRRMLEAAQHRFETATAEAQFSEANAQCLPFESESFDVVTVVTVLCFVAAPYPRARG